MRCSQCYKKGAFITCVKCDTIVCVTCRHPSQHSCPKEDEYEKKIIQKRNEALYNNAYQAPKVDKI